MTVMPYQNLSFESVPDAIRAEMTRQSITQDELARRMDWKQPQVSKRLRGQVPFKADEIERIARALDVPLDQLMSPRALAG